MRESCDGRAQCPVIRRPHFHLLPLQPALGDAQTHHGHQVVLLHVVVRHEVALKHRLAVAAATKAGMKNKENARKNEREREREMEWDG